MSGVIQAILSDSTATIEALAVLASGLYVLKLTFSEDDDSQAAGSTAAGSTAAGSKLYSPVQVEKPSRRLQLARFQAKLLRLFAVGELITTPKKSLRWQRVRLLAR